VQAITDKWLMEHNEYRPHDALGGMPPVKYIPQLAHAQNLYDTLST